LSLYISNLLVKFLYLRGFGSRTIIIVITIFWICCNNDSFILSIRNYLEKSALCSTFVKLIIQH